jgi:hypothetical protein
MSTHREILNAVLVDGTPDRCVGCHTPFLRADHLAEQVLEGALTQEEATTKLKTDTEEACRYGRRVIRAANGKITDINCMAHSFPTIAGMESPPPELMNWDEFESIDPPEDTPEAA